MVQYIYLGLNLNGLVELQERENYSNHILRQN